MPEPTLEPKLCGICGCSTRAMPCRSIPSAERCHNNIRNLKNYFLLFKQTGGRFMRVLYGGTRYDPLTEKEVRKTFIRLVGTPEGPPMPMLLLYEGKRPHE